MVCPLDAHDVTAAVSRKELFHEMPSGMLVWIVTARCDIPLKFVNGTMSKQIFDCFFVMAPDCSRECPCCKRMPPSTKALRHEQRNHRIS